MRTKQQHRERLDLAEVKLLAADEVDRFFLQFLGRWIRPSEAEYVRRRRRHRSDRLAQLKILRGGCDLLTCDVYHSLVRHALTTAADDARAREPVVTVQFYDPRPFGESA